MNGALEGDTLLVPESFFDALDGLELMLGDLTLQSLGGVTLDSMPDGILLGGDTTLAAAADSAIECEWMAGGPGQGPDEGRLPPRCHPRQADPFVLLLTAECPESTFLPGRRYAGIARWGTPEEFGRDSDTHALAPRLLFRASLPKSRASRF